jgi:hypothetical protein
MPVNQPIALAVPIALLAALAAFPRPAMAETRAENEKDRARAVGLLKEGARLLSDKEFAAALEKFRAAYRLVPSPKIQYNIALAAEGLDRPAEAMRAYRSYLDAPSGGPDKHQQRARERIAALRSRVTFLEITAEVADVTVLVDGVDEGRLPLAQPLVLNPGPHQVVVQRPGDEPPWVRAIRGEPGGSVALHVGQPSARPVQPTGLAVTPAEVPRTPKPPHPGLDLTDSAPPPAPEAPPFYARGWFWAVAAGVVAAATVTTVVLVAGKNTEFTCPAEPCLRGGR